MGSSPLKDLTFSWENPEKIILPVGSDNTQYIKYIDIGGKADLDYNVIADTNAQPGLYELSLHLGYQDTVNGQKQITSTAGVYVGGGTDFDVAFSESSGGQTSFSVANIGSNPAYSVSVIIPDQDSWRATGSNSVIIGNLNKGDYTIASFSIQPRNAGGASGRPGTQASSQASQSSPRPTFNSSSMPSTIKIELDYSDTMGQRNVVEKEVRINPMSITSSSTAGTGTTGGMGGAGGFRGQAAAQNQSFFSKYKWYFIGAILLILIILGHSWYKNKKLSDPDFSLASALTKKTK